MALRSNMGERNESHPNRQVHRERYNQEAIRKIRQPYSIDDDEDEQTFLTGLYDRPRRR